MEHGRELHQVVYQVLLTLIQFGTYRCGDRLPTIEDMAGQLLVSPDTVRAGYLGLKREGYISLTKNVGAVVRVRYSAQEIEGHIRDFFTRRRAALTDLSRSVGPLLGRAQYFGLRYARPETLTAMEQLSREGVSAPCVLLRHFKLKYDALGNKMLARLVWQIYIFYYAPFLSVPGNLRCLDDAGGYVTNLVGRCREKDWAGLRAAAVQFQDGFSHAVRRFLDKTAGGGPAVEETAFHWDSYRKPSQRCYSLAMELMMDIYQGIYPEGSLLPTAPQLAEEKGVSVSTVRRAQSLLLSAGAIKGTPGVGTTVLPAEQAVARCDLTSPSVRRCLSNMAQSLQILALSCKDVSSVTISALSGDLLRRWRVRLSEIIEGREFGGGVLAAMELIASSAPYQTVRLVYTQLLRHLFWYAAFRDKDVRTAASDAYCLACFERMAGSLEGQRDARAFSEALEALMRHELEISVERLSNLGIQETGLLLLPGRG